MGDNEQKSIWEAEVVIWVKKREYVRRKPEVSETDWLSLLSVGYCASVSACSPQRLPPFFILLPHFSFFASPPPPPPLLSRQLCLFHVLFCFIVCERRSCTADFYHFSDSVLRQTIVFLLCSLTHCLNDDFQLGPVRTVAVCCSSPARDRLETGSNGHESHAL